VRPASETLHNNRLNAPQQNQTVQKLKDSLAAGLHFKPDLISLLTFSTAIAQHVEI